MPATPNPQSPARTLFTSLGLIFFALFSASASAEPIQKLNMMIPPGHSELDDLQKDYEKASLELQGSFEQFQNSVRACDNGRSVAGAISKAAKWQKDSRERVTTSLNNSAAKLQTEIAKLDGAAVEGDSAAAVVTASKQIITTGISEPQGVIKKELPHLLAFNSRLERGQASASQLLTGDNSGCEQARNIFSQKIPNQAKALPEKLKKLYLALGQHKAALDKYADFVAESRNGASRTPASSAFPGNQ